jgi:hypothetical protein
MTVGATPPPFALAAFAALRRPRLRAIEVARATNTCLFVYRDGKIVLIPPEDLPSDPIARLALRRGIRVATPAAISVTVIIDGQRPAG